MMIAIFMDILANLIIQNYFDNSACLLIFTDEGNTFQYSGNIPVVIFKGGSDYNRSDFYIHHFGCQGIVMKTNNPVSYFKDFENDIKYSRDRFNKRRYLLLEGSSMKENLTDILLTDEIIYIADIDVIERKTDQTEECIFSIWTHSFVGADSRKPVLLDLWYSKNRTFMKTNDLFPNKLKDQQGRALRMATFPYEPYSIIDEEKGQYKGSEMSVAQEFAKHFNMTPIIIINEKDYWGQIFSNWSGNGLLGNLVLDRADIGFSALYTWAEDYNYLDLSKPLVRTGITCLVPAPRLAAGWLTPLYSYSLQMWIAVGIVFFICILTLYVLHYTNTKFCGSRLRYTNHKTNDELLSTSIVTIVKLFVLQAVTKYEMPVSISGKYFMGLLFLFEVFLTTTYSSGLATIMTIPRYEDPINTVHEFFRSGIYWGATQEAWITSIQRAKDPIYVEIVNHFQPTPEEELRRLSLEGKFAFSVERLPRGNFAIGTYIRKDVIGNFHLMQEDFYWEQCVIMTRKNSVLLPMLDMFILRVFEYGLISYWQNEAVILYMDSDVQSAVRYYSITHDKKDNVVKLKWLHVEGAFGILCLGHLISILIFCLEIIYDKVALLDKGISSIR